MKQKLKDIQVEYDQPISILCHNTSAVNIFRNLIMNSKTKHISMKYHFLREKVIEQNVKLEYIDKKEQIAELQIYLQNLFLEKYLSILDKNWGWSLCPQTTKALQEEH
jgi:hypothetical protein